MGCKRKKGKSSSRNKGKKMRDSNAKGAEKEGSDVEAAAEPALPEEGSSTAASTPTPSESASGSSPVPEAAQPLVKPAPRPASPAAAAPAPAAAATAAAAPESANPSPTPTPTPAEPEESAATPKPEAMPEPVPADASPAVAAPAPAVAIPNPTPASVASVPSVSSGAGINLFNPPFALPSPPILIPKSTSNKEKESAEKEDKLVAARNEENAKVSGLKDDGNDKRAYRPDQWSPNNPEGKKKYDRNFLMDLRSDPQSQKKPDGLPDMDVVLKDGNKKAQQNNFSTEFAPNVFIRSSGSRGPPPQRKSQQGKPKPGKPAVVHLSLSLREDVKLHETENAWKPGVLAGGKESNEEDAKTQELYKKVRGVLNKLTPQKFDKLVDQVQALPIDTPDRLKGVINLVFDKAVDEPNFSVAYAKMCNELRSKDVQGSSFRKILITRCQQEFEKNKDAESKHTEQKLKKIKAETDPEKRKELQFLYEEEERKVRMKSVGNIRFIGELYKLGMLTGPIMLRCVEDLLKEEDEESIECLCKLLSTIGKKLEANFLKDFNTQDVLAPYFNKMKDLADKNRQGRKMSSRVRFMLQDCIDLRNNKWVPRRDDSNPKTMDEIQRESERETIETNLALSQQSNTPRKDERMGRGMGGRGGDMDRRGGRGGMAMEDGWKQATSNRRPLDVNKLSKGLMQGNETATLGSPSQFSKWGGGSGGNAARDIKSISSRNVTITTGNPYAALNDKSSMLSDRKIPSGPPSRDRSMGGDGGGSRSSSQHRMGSQPASRDSSLARGKLEEERRNRVPTPSSVAGSSPSDDQPLADARKDSETGPVCKGKRVDDPEELERVVKNRVQELLGHKNIEEATLSVMDHFDWTNIVSFVREVLAFMLERMQGHQLVSQFLGHLIKINFMRKHHFLSALSEIVDLWSDLIMDIPRLWNHLGALVGFILLTEAVTFKDLAEPLNVLKGSKEAGLLLKYVIEVIVREKGPSWIRDHWNQHGISWSDFIDAKDVDDYVKENKFESFAGGAQASRSEMSRAEIQDKLLELLKSEVSFDDVQLWIESNVGERTKDPAFIRALMTAICKNAIHETHPSKLTLDSDKLRQDKLLLRYVDNKADLELQCLYAVQALVTQLDFPQGLILSIFNTLWEDNLLSTEAFQAWFDSEDPQESDGRGVCKKSLASFQTLLAEVENEEEEEHA